MHDAACRHDYESLLQLMEDPFGIQEPSDVLDTFRANNGAELTVVMQTLETPAILGQGGLIYCNPNGAIAVFARGTLAHPGKWTDFTFTADSALKEECQEPIP
ncbi:hypothetical protein GCM10029964_088250 [Kibdelosporangium lantanae]